MISHTHRFIFVHVGRTGGSTIERMAGAPVTEDPRTQRLGNIDFSDKHAGLQHYYSAFPEQFRAYFKFTIVRNSFDRLHSAWHWRTRVVQDLRVMPLCEFIDTRPPGYSFAERFAVDGSRSPSRLASSTTSRDSRTSRRSTAFSSPGLGSRLARRRTPTALPPATTATRTTRRPSSS